MTIDMIRKDLYNHIGESATIRCNLGRNKIEEYDVTIKKVYNHIFLVEINGINKIIKSFSYSDVITKIVSINYKKIVI